MSLLAIAGKDVLLLVRDKKALLTLVGTPLVLTFVLGMAFSAMWSSDVPPSLILYINDDEGTLGDILFTEVLAMDGIREWVRLEEVPDRDGALRRVRAGEATAFIEITPGFSRDVVDGAASVTVAGDPASSVRAGIITGIVNRFAAEISSRAVIGTALGSAGMAVPPGDMEAALGAVALEVRVADGYEEEGSEYVPMDYYAAGMGVMYLLFTVSHGASTLLRERETYTLARMVQSPVRPWQIGAGKMAGMFAIAVVQMTAVILFSTLAFGVRWGNPAGVALLTLSAALGASGIGLVIAAVSRNHSAAGALGTAIILPMSVLGGSMMPLFSLPPVMRSLSRLTVNGLALDGYVRLMFEGAGPGDVATHAVLLTAAGILLIAVSGTLLIRKGAAP